MLNKISVKLTQLCTEILILDWMNFILFYYDINVLCTYCVHWCITTNLKTLYIVIFYRMNCKWVWHDMFMKTFKVLYILVLRLTALTVYPKKYAHGFCFAVLCCGYTLTDIPISIRLTSLALWQSNDCPSASKATLMNMDKYFMWIYYERLHNHNKAKHNKTVCIFLGIYCKIYMHIICTMLHLVVVW